MHSVIKDKLSRSCNCTQLLRSDISQLSPDALLLKLLRAQGLVSHQSEPLSTILLLLDCVNCRLSVQQLEQQSIRTELADVAREKLGAIA